MMLCFIDHFFLWAAFFFINWRRLSADIIVLLDDEPEELPALVFEWPKFGPWVPDLDELFKPEEALDPDDPLYVAARAAIPAGLPPDAELDAVPCDFEVSVRLKTADVKQMEIQFFS